MLSEEEIHDSKLNPTNFPRMGGCAGHYALLLGTDLRMRRARMLCCYFTCIIAPRNMYLAQSSAICTFVFAFEHCE